MMNRHYSWLIDPTTGDYAIVNGNPVRDESLQFPAYVRMKIKRGAWLYAPDTDYGSEYSNVRKRTNKTPALLQSIGERALQPLLDDGRATDIEFETMVSNRNIEQLQVTITDSDGATLSFQLTPVGG